MNNQYYFNGSDNSSNNNYYDNQNGNYSNNNYYNDKQNKRASSQFSYNNMSSSGIEDNYSYQLGQYNYYMQQQQQQPSYPQSQSSYRKFPQQQYNFSQNIEMPSFQNISQNFPTMSQVSNQNYQQKRNSNPYYFNQSGNSQYSDQNENLSEQFQQLKKDIKKQLSKIIYVKNINYQQRIKNTNNLLNTIKSLNTQEISNIINLLLSYNGLEKIFIDLNAPTDLKKISIEIISVLSKNGDPLINDFIFNWIFNILNDNKPNSNLLKDQESEKKLWILLSIEKTLSQDYPDIFNNKYEEIIDLLIGWYIDPQLPKKVLKLIDKTFEMLHDYVSRHIKFILEILSNLLTDVDTVFEKECIEDNNIATSESLIGEIKEVIPNDNEQIKSISEVSEDIDILLVKFLELLIKISKVSYLNKWIAQGKLFIPYQYAACICSIERMELVLRLDNKVTELFNITINDLFEVIFM
ncbi:hypothetical protein PIROE2DRAFT_9740 [Piromyces sp. E2]|nr:hypothetical protein PIROE2DRAFT_9740 [Piromyces sp. E2]|eukprot:OUM63667.1 hypothetical protein PIROE2DRAFT_9740 [Piromyces sp. E2]